MTEAAHLKVGETEVELPVTTGSENERGLDISRLRADTGLITIDENDDGTLRANFPDSEGGIRNFSPARLPAHETVYATTIHKSQGSEYSAVTLLLPPVGSPLLKRELLYTAVTRASGSVTVVGSEAAVRTAVLERAVRMTGLTDALTTP